MVDDSLLNSPSMAVLSPRAQDAFVRFILLADDFGCFEVSPRQLAAKGWPDREKDVTETDVEAWLAEYATRRAPGEAPVAMLWTDRARRWCFLTGWFGKHGQRRRAEYDPKTTAGEKGSKRRTPPPPGDLLAAVMAGEVRLSDGLPPGAPTEDELSRANPGGNAREAENGKPNNSVPARETHDSRPGSADFPRIPAAAVPVAVPAAAAVAAETTTAAADPFGAEAPRPRLVVVDETGIPPSGAPAFPLVAAFRGALADRLAVPADWLRVASADRVASVRDDLERELARVGIHAAVEASFEAAVREQRGNKRRPQHLAWYLRVIQDLTPAGAEPPPQPRRQVVVGFDSVGTPVLGEAGTPFRGEGSP